MTTLAYIGQRRRKGHAIPAGVLVAEWHALDRIKRREEQALEAAARRLFRDQETAVLEALSTQGKRLSILAGLFDIERWRTTTGNLFAPLLARILGRGFDAGSERIVFEGDLTSSDPDVLRFLQTLVSKTRDITDTTARELAEALQEGLTASETTAQLAGRVRRLFVQYRTDRADLIAQTAGAAAFERGQQLSFERAGITEKAWLSRRDGRVRRPPQSKYDHVEADGQRVLVAAPFIVSGELLMHPGDFTLGASAGNTIRCRCSSLPML